jgi:uncharacterized membrane protein
VTARAVLLPATPLTRAAVRLMVLIILATALFLVVEYPSLPWLLPVHFKVNGYPNGWQYRTMPRVMMPVFVQIALAATLGAIGLLLLSRPNGDWSDRDSDAKTAAVATEAVMLIALIWVAFQAYAACALVGMWTSERAGLGWWYLYLEFHGLFLTVAVAVRAHLRAGRPAPRPFVPEHWWFGQLYKNADDPALFVPARDGRRWTLNFGRPVAAALLGVVLTIGIIVPTAILALLLR